MRSFISPVALVLAICLFTGCTKSSEDGGGGGDALSQFQGDCSLRVANGVKCDPKQGPVALITLISNNQEIAICTGTFLTRSVVLTAAHCFVESGADTALVSAAGESGESEDILVHPRYRSGGISEFDAAIIKLPKALDVATLPLFLSEAPDSGDTLNIIGYGLDESGHSAGEQAEEDSLHKGVMSYEGREMNVLVYTPGKGGQTICPGDSGGPGIAINRDDLPGVLGIANAVSGRNIGQLERCKGVELAAFTDVQLAAVSSWILENVPGAGSI